MCLHTSSWLELQLAPHGLIGRGEGIDNGGGLCCCPLLYIRRHTHTCTHRQCHFSPPTAARLEPTRQVFSSHEGLCRQREREVGQTCMFVCLHLGWLCATRYVCMYCWTGRPQGVACRQLQSECAGAALMRVWVCPCEFSGLPLCCWGFWN